MHAISTRPVPTINGTQPACIWQKAKPQRTNKLPNQHHPSKNHSTLDDPITALLKEACATNKSQSEKEDEEMCNLCLHQSRQHGMCKVTHSDPTTGQKATTLIALGTSWPTFQKMLKKHKTKDVVALMKAAMQQPLKQLSSYKCQMQPDVAINKNQPHSRIQSLSLVCKTTNGLVATQCLQQCTISRQTQRWTHSRSIFGAKTQFWLLHQMPKSQQNNDKAGSSGLRCSQDQWNMVSSWSDQNWGEDKLPFRMDKLKESNMVCVQWLQNMWANKKTRCWTWRDSTEGVRSDSSGDSMCGSDWSTHCSTEKEERLNTMGNDCDGSRCSLVWISWNNCKKS